MTKTPKLQEIVRASGTKVYPIFIPVAIVEENNLKKGDEIEFITTPKGILMRKVNG